MDGSLLSAPAARRRFALALLKWFAAHARDLPWRRTSDLYAIWISEIMLQQTQVATVIDYFNRFLAAFPDVVTLAAAPESQVLRLWEGLGYYRRARQLHAAASQVVRNHAAIFPRSYEEVRALPGIGRYTAGAILSIGLDQRLPILEANTIRVLSRLIALRDDPRSSKSQACLWQVAEELLPAENCGAFNQALMELGSEICTPREPNCAECPVATHCLARRERLTNVIPLAAKKMKYEDVTETAVILRRNRNFFVRQCQPGERWAGLWDFPRFASLPADDKNWQTAAIDQLQTWLGIEAEPLTHVTTTRHGVTRFRITLHVLEAKWIAGGKTGDNARWISREELADLPLSVTGRKIAALLSTGQQPRKKAKGTAAK